MNEFVFLYRGGMDGSTASAQEMQAQMGRWQAWLGKLQEEGKLKDFGAPLQSGAKLVASGGVITDGPFSEGKEIIGGYSIVKAKDIEEAAQIAKGCPIFQVPTGSVEVRPVQAM
ncbi:MAG TPA: YciI family protein [Candidatus Kapabacteria bacterium]|nr:YciI family protein [Candidatus Kapabacteria bacterium]